MECKNFKLKNKNTAIWHWRVTRSREIWKRMDIWKEYHCKCFHFGGFSTQGTVRIWIEICSLTCLRNQRTKFGATTETGNWRNIPRKRENHRGETQLVSINSSQISDWPLNNTHKRQTPSSPSNTKRTKQNAVVAHQGQSKAWSPQYDRHSHTHTKFTVNIILNNGILNLFPKIRRWQGCPPPPFLFSILLEILAGVIRKIKSSKDQKGRSKTL